MELDLKTFKPHNCEDRFGDVMKQFCELAKEQYLLVDGMYKKMETSYLELSKYFTFEIKQYPMEDCFNDLKQFKDQYIQALADNHKQREIEEKNRRNKEAKEKAQKERRERVSHKIDPKIADCMEQGLMEHLLSSIHDGSAFAQHKRKRNKPVTPQGWLKKISNS